MRAYQARHVTGDLVAKIEPYEASLHTGAVSKGGLCGQGGQDTCRRESVFSVIGDRYNVAACDVHVAGAVRQALGLPQRSQGR